MAVENVKALEKALQILDCFTKASELSLHELHQMTDIPKSTLVRLLTTLAGYDFIKQNPTTTDYTLGFKVLTLGGLFQQKIDVRREALPFMKKLAKELGETVDLNVVDQGERVCVEVVETTQDIRHFVRVGQRSELYRGATGKGMLAFLPELQQEELLMKASIDNVDVSLLRTQLTKIRQDGYAITRGERVPGSFAISAPIFNHEGVLISGITVSGPILRLTDERQPQLIAQVVVTAREISRLMGHQPLLSVTT